MIKGLRKVYASFKQDCGPNVVPNPKYAFTAVDNMWLMVRDKQMFTILGHNGAGKTTTLSMLTGLLRSTEGDAEVFGKSLGHDVNGIRKLEGVCPQHDVIWDSLTAREHIEMFAGLKGVPPAEVEQEVRDRLGDVELMHVAEAFAGSFSGGMKRRLSVALALTANPRITYLDEPTTGMDPVSRRQVWNLLEREKRKRCIILTTHSMEEADVLSDNVAIMRRGRIQCMGAPVKLKRQYGTGFRLTLLCKHAHSTVPAPTDGDVSDGSDGSDGSVDHLESAVELMRAVAPGAKLERRGIGVLEYVLPKHAGEAVEVEAKEAAAAAATGGDAGDSDADDAAATVLADTLKAVAAGAEAAGIIDVQVGLTDLEQVFLTVTGAGRVDDKGNEVHASDAKAKEEAEVAAAAAAAAITAGRDKAGAASPRDFDNPVTPHLSPRNAKKRRRRDPTSVKFDLRAQFRALTAKSSLVQMRAIKSNLFQILLPLALVFALWGLQQLVTSFIQDLEGSVIPAQPHPPTLPVPFITPETGDYDATACPRAFAAPAIDSVTGEILYAVDPSGAAIAAAGDRDAAVAEMLGTLGSYGAPVPVDASQFWSALADSPEEPSGLLSEMTRDILQMTSIQGRVFGGGGRAGRPPSICPTRPFLMPLTFDYVGDGDDLDDVMFARYAVRSHAAGIVFNDLQPLQGDDAPSGGAIKYAIMWNDTMTAGQDKAKIDNLVTNSVFGALGGRVLEMAGFRYMPTEERAVDFDLIALIAPTFFVLLYQLIFPVALNLLVYEKQYKLREIMKLMGLKTEVYFASNYLVFFLLYIIAITVWQVVAILLDFRFFTENNYFLVFLLNLLFGLCQLSLAFVASTLFSSAKTATVAGYSFIFAAGTIASALIRTYFESEDTPEATMFVLQLIPQFAMYRGLLAFRDGVAFDAPGLSLADLSREDVPLVEVYVYLTVMWVLLCALAWYLELVVPSSVGVKRHPLFCFQRSYWRQKAEREAKRAARLAGSIDVERQRAEGLTAARQYSKDHNEPADVAAERAAMWSAERSGDLVRIVDLCKTYKSQRAGVPDKKAVSNLSLGIREGECLGLLGPNGSGKTTTINTLSGYFEPTSGGATICGLDIADDMDIIHQLSGICPQENVLWDTLSCADHIRFYARLKDLSGDELDAEVKARLEDVELYDVADKAAGKLSGGMKRRLCVAIALTGSPAVVLLDEPTTGLDPAARRQLWAVIDNASRRSAVLLTTHSMQEAEALCQRVGVFVNGTLRAIGTPAALKATVGDFYKVVLSCDEAEGDGSLGGSVSGGAGGSARDGSARDGSITIGEASPADVVVGQPGDPVHDYILSLSPSASLITAPLAGNRNYQVLKAEVSLPALVESLNRDARKLGVADWGVSNVSLEEVFLKISQTALSSDGAGGAAAAQGVRAAPATAEDKADASTDAASSAAAARHSAEQVVPVAEQA